MACKQAWARRDQPSVHDRGMTRPRLPRCGSSLIDLKMRWESPFSFFFSRNRVLFSDSCGKGENSCVVEGTCAFLQPERSRRAFLISADALGFFDHRKKKKKKKKKK